MMKHINEKNQADGGSSYFILNAMKGSVCVIDEKGDVIAANDSWMKFNAQLNGDSAGDSCRCLNFDMCLNSSDQPEGPAKKFLQGMMDVLAGEINDFSIEYPFNADGGTMWFCGTVTRFVDPACGEKRLLVSHEDITSVKTSGDNLRKLTQAVEQSPVTVVITDLDGSIEYVNQKFIDLTGYSLEEARGQNPRILKSGNTDPRVYQHLWKVIKSGKQWRGVFQNRNKNGDLYYESASIAPVFSDTGEMTNFIAVKEDITKRMLAETQLRKSREQYALAVKGSMDGIWDWDLSADVLYFSPRYKEMIGYADDEFTNSLESFEANLHPDDRTRVMDFIMKFLAGPDNNYSIEFRFRHREGRYLWILGRGIALRDKSGKVFRMAGSHTDISQQKQTERILQIRLDLFTYAANHNVAEILQKTLDEVCALIDSPLGFYHLIRDDEKTIILQAWSTRTLGEFCNTSGRGQHYDKDKAGVWVECMRRREPVVHNDFAALTEKKGYPDGHPVITRELVVPIIRENKIKAILGIGNKPGEYNDNDVRIVSFFADLAWVISESKRAEDELREARIRAEEASRAKSDFLASVSHELRTPLNSILGFTQILDMQTSGTLNDKQAEYNRYIMASGTHLLDMINDILDISKLDAGTVEITKKTFDLGRMLSDFPDTMRSISVKKNITVKKSISGDIGFINADEARVRQILVNLLSNAVKFTEPGGEAGIEARGDGDYAVITVWDTGIGIEKEDIARIFNPFEKAGLSVSAKKGTGLGLAISRSLAEIHGGRIELESEPGRGSRFTVYLPGRIQPSSSAVSPVAPETSSAAEAADCGSTRILVVEDETVNQILMKSLLKIIGCEPVIAPTGEDAVKMASVERFDLVIMDINLPGINGIEAMRRIKSSTSYYIPFIALTAHAIKGDEDRFRMEGMDEVLSKPVDFKTLKTLVGKYINLPKRGDKPEPAVSSYNIAEAAASIGISAEQLKPIIDRFFSVLVKNYMENLLEAVKADNYQEIRAAAHKFKGAASNLRFTRCAFILGGIEADAENAIAADYQQSLDALVKELEMLETNIYGLEKNS